MNFANWSDSWEEVFWEHLDVLLAAASLSAGWLPLSDGLWPQKPLRPGITPSCSCVLGPSLGWTPLDQAPAQLLWSPHRLKGEIQPSISHSTECSCKHCPYCFPTVYNQIYVKQIQCHEALSFFFYSPLPHPHNIVYSLKGEFKWVALSTFRTT